MTHAPTRACALLLLIAACATDDARTSTVVKKGLADNAWFGLSQDLFER